MKTLPKIVITAGEPAGIGLDVCALLASQKLPACLTIIADQNALQQRANLLKISLKINSYVHDLAAPHIGNGQLNVLHVPTDAPVIAGQLNPKNSAYVLHTLKLAADGCRDGAFDAMVTAPVHKGVINDAGIAFSGHTEFLADYTQTQHVVMMLVGGGLKVALATTHLALKDVPAAITKYQLETTIRILNNDLKTKFGIAAPKIFVAGLNPHAGENGYLGREEIEIINPVLEKFRAEGFNLIGTLPADTMFCPKNIAEADAFLCMYHDQGLPVLKHASFGAGVNITLGLPIIRTSVDHGTALDLAGKGGVEIGSMIEATKLAIALAKNKTK